MGLQAKQIEPEGGSFYGVSGEAGVSSKDAPTIPARRRVGEAEEELLLPQIPRAGRLPSFTPADLAEAGCDSDAPQSVDLAAQEEEEDVRASDISGSYASPPPPRRGAPIATGIGAFAAVATCIMTLAATAVQYSRPAAPPVFAAASPRPADAVGPLDTIAAVATLLQVESPARRVTDIRHVERINQARDEGVAPMALVALETWRLGQQDVPARSVLRGLEELSRGRETEALRHFEDAVKQRPEFVPALLGKADVLWQQGHQGSARDLYRAVLRLAHKKVVLPVRVRERTQRF